MSDLPYKSWKNTPLDPTPAPPNSPASKLPPPATAPFYRVFQLALLRNRVLAEVMMASALLGAGVVWWRKRATIEGWEESGSEDGGGRATIGSAGADHGQPNTHCQQVKVVRERQ